MKTKLSLFVLVLFISASVNAQLHAGIAAGSGTDNSFVADVRFGYHQTNLNYVIELHEILSLSPEKPCYFGARIGKGIAVTPNSYIMPMVGYYYSVFTGNNITVGELPVTDNKWVVTGGVMYVSGNCSLEARQINNTFQVTFGIWNIFKSKN